MSAGSPARGKTMRNKFSKQTKWYEVTFPEPIRVVGTFYSDGTYEPVSFDDMLTTCDKLFLKKCGISA